MLNTYYTQQARMFAGWTLDQLKHAQEKCLLSRLAAIPGVISVAGSLHDVPVVNDRYEESEDGDEIDVADAIETKLDTEIRQIVLPRHIIVGGLVYDSDAENPIEDSDGNGRLLHAENRKERDEMLASMGRDDDGEPRVDSGELYARMAPLVWTTMSKDMNLMLWLNQHHRAGGQVRVLCDAVLDAVEKGGETHHFASAVFGGRMPDPAFAQLLDGVVQRIRAIVLRRMIKEGAFGDPMAIPLDIYEHGGRMYSFSGEGMQCRFDTSRCAAMWLPDEGARENILYHVATTLGAGRIEYRRGDDSQTSLPMLTTDEGRTWTPFATWSEALRALNARARAMVPPATYRKAQAEQARAYAKPVIDEYNDWCSGSCYGVCTYVIDRRTGERIEDQVDECWGYIGTTYATSELDGNLFALVERFLQPEH